MPSLSFRSLSPRWDCSPLFLCRRRTGSGMTQRAGGTWVWGFCVEGTAQANDPGLLHQEATSVLGHLFPPGAWRAGLSLLRVRLQAAVPSGRRKSTKTSTWPSTAQVRSPASPLPGTSFSPPGSQPNSLPDPSQYISAISVANCRV